MNVRWIGLLGVSLLPLASGCGSAADADSPQAGRGLVVTPVVYAPPPAAQPAEDYFADWKTPLAALVISGEMNGYLEPCGCAGLENMKGGIGRRHDLLARLRGKGWSVLPVDVGSQVKRFGQQSEIKFHAAINGLKQMQYAAVAFGARDLKLPAGDLVNEVVDEKNAFTSANVGLFGLDSGITPPQRIISAGDKKIGITAILGASYQKQLNNPEVQFAAAETALKKVVPQLKAQCDCLVLLSHASVEESTELAKKFPEFHVVVTAGGAEEPPAQPKQVGKTLLVEVGHKGMHVGLLAWYDDAKQPWRFERVALDKRFSVTPEMKQVMVEYQEHLKLRGFTALGLKPVPHESGHKFVGSAACGDCHTQAAAVWNKTPHAQALKTLTQADPPRHFDAECVSCHVTGWRTRVFDAYTSGYWSPKKTPHLGGVGCENCHGPGSAHVAAENGDIQLTAAQIAALRKEMALPLDQAERKCAQCHDLDNSPHFDFDTYWPKIEHHGKN